MRRSTPAHKFQVAIVARNLCNKKCSGLNLASSGFVASMWSPTLGFSLIDEVILQQFENLMAITTLKLTF